MHHPMVQPLDLIKVKQQAATTTKLGMRDIFRETIKREGVRRARPID